MRAKAAAFLESGGVDAVRKEFSRGNERVSDPGPEILSPFPVDAHVQKSTPATTEMILFEDKLIVQESTPVEPEMTQFEDKVIEENKVESNAVVFPIASKAVGMNSFQNVCSVQFLVAETAVVKSVAAKSGSVSGVVIPVSILLGKVLCFGWSFLRVDDKPPDPGKQLLQARGNDNSAQTCVTLVTRVCYHHEKKKNEFAEEVYSRNYKFVWARRFQQVRKKMGAGEGGLAPVASVLGEKIGVVGVGLEEEGGEKKKGKGGDRSGGEFQHKNSLAGLSEQPCMDK
jgi:hypothetical protein